MVDISSVDPSPETVSFTLMGPVESSRAVLHLELPGNALSFFWDFLVDQW